MTTQTQSAKDSATKRLALEQALIFQSPGHYEMTGLPQEFDGSGEQEREIRQAINQNCGWDDVFDRIIKSKRPAVPGFCTEGVSFTLRGVAVVYSYGASA